MSEPTVIDTKFSIQAKCHEHGHIHSEGDAVLFLAQDNAFPAALKAYRAECEALGAGARQLLAVDNLIERVRMWRARYPWRCKVPDVDDTDAGRAVIDP